MNTYEEQTREVREKYQQYINPSLVRLLKITGYDYVENEAEGAIVRDISGKEFIDCCGGYGVFTVGHRHPKVISAVQEQLAKMPLSSKVFLNKPMADLAEKLASITPGDLKFSFFGNSGAEAVEGAIKIARLNKGKPHLISTRGAFHGKTLGALSASGREVYRDPFKPLLDDFTHVPFGDAEAIEAAITEKTAAVIIEPIQGEAGIIVPPDDYLPRVREICHRNKILLIIDEIQTGLGKTGKMFAVNHAKISPDLMTLAKALGGGVMPIGAFIGTSDVWEAFKPNPLIHTSTFGGNQLACVAALATINVIQEENLPEKARHLGKYLLSELNQLKDKYPNIIESVRGIGLMIGLEFKDEGLGGNVMFEMLREGVIAVYTLNNQKVVRFEPPLIITKKQLERVIEVVEKALEETDKVYDRLIAQVQGQTLK